nr:hypothetical protein [Lachnospiraceae bacterium]
MKNPIGRRLLCIFATAILLTACGTVERFFTVSFDNCSNGSIKVKEGEEIEVPEYKGKTIKDFLDLSDITLYEDRDFCINEEPVCPKEMAVIDEEEKEIVLKNINIPYAIKYAVNKEDDTVYPIRLEQYGRPVGNSGISIVLEYKDNEDGRRVYTFKGLTDMFGRDIDEAEIYYGDFKGWSSEEMATEAEYLAGDNLSVSRDISLYPVFDTNDTYEEVLEEGAEYKTITSDAKDIVNTNKWGSISVNDEGIVITDREGSSVDQESG